MTLLICFVCFLSFVSAAQDFSGYQSDGMLLEAGFIALFFAPPGLRPGLGGRHPPSRASLFLLQWEWFRIYFESGLVKLLSGDEEWRHLTAMDDYYQNGPLPTWVGYYVQHLPHWFHVSTALATLVMELGIVWMMFLPRHWRVICFLIVTPWELGVILTANYTFLNYLVLTLGFLLLDDAFFVRRIPWLKERLSRETVPVPDDAAIVETEPSAASSSDETLSSQGARTPASPHSLLRGRRALALAGLGANALFLTWISYATVAELLRLVQVPLPMQPVAALEPFRIANQYGLFAVMTRGRYEIEFQGSQDGETWVPYAFRYKPQDLNQPPGIYAPYQPRFDWNLWFASLGSWRENPLVPRTEIRLLENDPQVLALFKGSPFGGSAPREVRAVLWQYWFTSSAQKRATGAWWRRQLLGLYAPALEQQENGGITITEMPGELPPHN
jgi:lipase maturation factor 1